MAKRFVSNQDVTVRIFQNDILESVSHIHPSTPVIVFVPVVVSFLFHSWSHLGQSFFHVTVWFGIGLVVWTLAEYLLHRFIFHFTPSNPIMARVHFLAHGVHHDYPMDSKRLVMPPPISVPLAGLFYLLFLAMVGEDSSALTAGFLTGYMIYDVIHFAIHHFNMHSPFWLAVKNHHMRHHFQDSDRGFGVSSPLWDQVFGTAFPHNHRSEPIQATKDAASQQVQAKHGTGSPQTI